MSKYANAPMAASTGIHNGDSFVKLLMAGAQANCMYLLCLQTGLK